MGVSGDYTVSSTLGFSRRGGDCSSYSAVTHSKVTDPSGLFSILKGVVS